MKLFSTLLLLALSPLGLANAPGEKIYQSIDLPNEASPLPVDAPAVQTFLQQFKLKCPNSVNIEKLSQAIIDPTIITRMQKPAEKKPWSFYQKIFLTTKRIEDGKWFMRQNRRTLRNIQSQYRVPSTLITAIIGVETMYGQRMGNDRLIDSLSTLAFYYPRRAAFFQAELACYLNQSCSMHPSHLQTKGSYAGAFGIPQFMPCSYQNYAVSLHSDKADIIHSSTDAIVSVANYLKVKGKWQPGQPIIRQMTEAEGERLPQAIREKEDVTKLTDALCKSLKCPTNAIKVWCPEKECYWLYPNFDSIMTYNISRNYALAVTLLSQAL